MNTSSPDKTVVRPRSLLGILSFLRRYRWMAVLAVLMLLCMISLEMSLPRVSGSAINHLKAASAFHEMAHVDPNTAGGPTYTSPFNPWTYAWIFLGLVLARAILAFGLGRLRNRIIQSTLRDIRAAYFDAVQGLSFAYHDKTNTGELISRGTADISRLQEFIFACLFLGIDIFIAMIMTLVLITIISPVAGLATLLTLGPTVGLLVYYARKLNPRWRKIHDLHGEMTTVIQENIAGVRVVKAFARENDEITKFRASRDIFVKTIVETVNFWAGRVPMAQFVFGLSTPIILWICGTEVIAGRMPVGNLVMILFYLMGIGARMEPIGQFVNILQNAAASSSRIMEVIDEPLRMSGGTELLTAKVGAGVRVVFEGVSFQYPSGNVPALQDISFVAQPGQTVAIIGETGAGKSTLVHLIPRFYDPTAGKVKINGVDVKDLDLRGLRRSVGMIFQETVLFSATVADNIAYGRSSATKEEIIAAAKAAHAHEFITSLDRGYDTVIGERGVSLSGGQKQRLAIARAFLLDPLILILDDATSSLDSKTERLIQEDMRRVCFGRTAFVIAHRLTTIQHADHVIVMRDGRIVESGTPAELTERGIYFKELFRDQWHAPTPPNSAVEGRR